MTATQQLRALGQSLWRTRGPAALAAPDTINTIPENPLLAFADHGGVKGAMPIDGGDAGAVLADFAAAGIRDDKLAADRQREDTAAFAKSWKELMGRIASKRGVT